MSKVIYNINYTQSYLKCEWCKTTRRMCVHAYEKGSSHNLWDTKTIFQNVGLVRFEMFLKENVSGYVCNHGSPNGELELRPLGVATGNALSVTRVWRYICKNTTCWPATAHDVTTGVPQYKCRRENTSSASSSEACVRSMAQSLGDAVSRSPFGEPWLHT